MNYGVGDIVIVTPCMNQPTYDDELDKFLLPVGHKYVCSEVVDKVTNDAPCPLCGVIPRYSVRMVGDALPRIFYGVEVYGYAACCFTLAPRPALIEDKTRLEAHV